MRRVLVATLLVAGIGFVGASATTAASAAPINTLVIKQAAPASQIVDVGWRHARCHVRWRSWWRWC